MFYFPEGIQDCSFTLQGLLDPGTRRAGLPGIPQELLGYGW